MANKVVNYKKIRTDIINGKKRCIYMKPKGKREYVKSKGEFVLLSVYIKKMQKKMKIKGGVFSCLGFGCKNNSKINSEINSEKSHTVTADLVFDNTGADDDRTHIVPPPITPRERSEWTVHKSKKHGRNYYYNADTRETLWNLPSGAKADDDHSTNSSKQYQEDQQIDYYVPYNSPRNNKKNKEKEYYIDRKGNMFEKPENDKIERHLTISMPRTKTRTKTLHKHKN